MPNMYPPLEYLTEDFTALKIPKLLKVLLANSVELANTLRRKVALSCSPGLHPILTWASNSSPTCYSSHVFDEDDF